MSDAQSPTFLRFMLGHQLRELRERAELTTDEVGARIEASGSTVSRIETGKVGVKQVVLGQLLDMYEVTDPDHRETLLALARQGKQRGWLAKYSDLPPSYSQFIGLEAAADEMRNYEPLIVPGLLQTEAYARAMILAARPTEAEEWVDRRVQARMARQQLLDQERSLRMIAVLDEGVLHRQIGGPAVLKVQLEKLKQRSESRNVTIQVLPFSGGAYAGMVGSFAILGFGSGSAPQVVYAEGLTADLYSEGEDVARYKLVFENLLSAALSPLESKKLIDARVKELA